MLGANLSITDTTLDAASAAAGSGSFIQFHLNGSITATATINCNSTTYMNPGVPYNVTLDRDAFPATHYRLVIRGRSSEAGQTVKMQLAAAVTPTTPSHTGGDDLTFTNTLATLDTGWLSLDDGASGLWQFTLALKGSNGTVDFLQVGTCEVMFKIS